MFPVLHGPYGEDGTIQGLLELANVPYVGAGVAASALGMDKALMKVVFAARGLPIGDYRGRVAQTWEQRGNEIAAELERALEYPMFVKPANLGSSVGISKAKTPADLRAAMELAGSFDRKIVVEAAVPNAREIECAVLGNDEPQASIPGEVIPSREFYDYEAKYLDDRIRGGHPRRSSARAGRGECSVCRRRHSSAIDCAGMARVDFLLARDTGAIVVNESQYHPGLHERSACTRRCGPRRRQLLGVDRSLVELALERHAAKQQLRTSIT
jgi:D-alanine-D-alanine ligase